MPENFFSAIEPGLAAAAKDEHVAAIVPHLAEGAQLLSPAYVGLTRTKPMPASFTGVPSREARAFNSAALLRVRALDAIGGFDPCFWLDHLDSWLHHQLYLHGWRMYVLDSVHLEHHFSLLNYRERVTLAHFRNFLGAESAYFDLYGSWMARLAYSAQLAVRLVNQRRRGEAREIRSATWKALWRRAECNETTAHRCLAQEHGWMAGRRDGREGLMQNGSGARARCSAGACVCRSRSLSNAARTFQDARRSTRAFAADSTLTKQIEVLVWDNSPTAIDESALPFPCTYRHASANAGVSGAYNAAAEMAAERDCSWLLLLDQDTSVTKEYLSGILAHAAQVAREEQVAAVVPFLYAENFCLSPRLWHFGRHAPLPRSAGGRTERREMFAANSGTLMRVRALQAIGGYSSRFWLDYSDIDVFYRLHVNNFSVRIAGDLVLQHEVALLDYDIAHDSGTIHHIPGGRGRLPGPLPWPRRAVATSA